MVKWWTLSATVHRVDLAQVVALERRRLADLFDSLTPAQLATPSLCAEWTVQQVGGHLIAQLVGTPRMLLTETVRSGFRLHAGNARLASRLAQRPAGEIAAALREHATKPIGTFLGPYADLHIHGQDIRRPLGLPHGFALDQLRVVLDFLVGGRAWGFLPRTRTAGLRLETSDLSWTHGSGPPVTGPAEALMLGLTGRDVAFGELDGPGVGVLRERIAAGR